MPKTYIYVFKWFKVSKKTRKTSEVCKKPVLQNKTGGCYIMSVRILLVIPINKGTADINTLYFCRMGTKVGRKTLRN